MKTAVNQRFTAKLAEIYLFKRTEAYKHLTKPARLKRHSGGDLQPYTNNSSYQWYPLGVVLTKVAEPSVRRRFVK